MNRYVVVFLAVAGATTLVLVGVAGLTWAIVALAMAEQYVWTMVLSTVGTAVILGGFATAMVAMTEGEDA